MKEWFEMEQPQAGQEEDGAEGGTQNDQPIQEKLASD